MQVFKTLIVLVMAISLFSCKKEIIKEYTYQVDSVTVKKPGIYKPNTKNNTEFISIAYADLFGTPITSDKLINLSIAYDAFGDKKLMEDLIIRNFLNNPSVIIPSATEMNVDKEAFIKNTYKKFLNRLPNEFELWQLKKTLDEDPSITPEIFYYSFLTCNEYRNY